MVFHRRLCDSKSAQVSRSLLIILGEFNNAVVWMVSTRPPNSKSSRPFNDIHSLCQKHQSQLVQSTLSCSLVSSILSPGRDTCPSFHILSVLFCGKPGSTVDNFAGSLFLVVIFRSAHLADIWRSVCMSKSHRGLCVSFSRTGAGLCIYHMLVWSNLNFLHISHCITLPTQSCLVLYSFDAHRLHSLIM